MTVAAVLATACSTTDSVESPVAYRILGGPLADAPRGSDYDVAVVADERALLITTIGGVNCPVVPVRLYVVSRSEVELEVGQRTQRICTAENGRMTSLVQLDDRLDLARPLVVRIVDPGGVGGRFVARRLAALPGAH